MKNNFKISLLFLFLAGFSSQAQVKKWTLQECVDYALKNNISIQQTDLDNKTAAIDKTAAFGNFLPSINANASHSWNIGLNQNKNSDCGCCRHFEIQYFDMAYP